MPPSAAHHQNNENDEPTPTVVPGWFIALVSIGITIATAAAFILGIKSDVRDAATINAQQDQRIAAIEKRNEKFDDAMQAIGRDLAEMKADIKYLRAKP